MSKTYQEAPTYLMTMPIETPYQKAARLYFERREQYRRAVQLVQTPDLLRTDENWISAAFLARVRHHFGQIGRGLTTQIGCDYCAACGQGVQKTENEHAVPLNLIHNRILGITGNGLVDPATRDLFPSPASIESFIKHFVIGVKVTAGQHTRLNRHFKKCMPTGWDWLADHMPLIRNEQPDQAIVKSGNVMEAKDRDSNPLWLRKIMGRYHNLPDGAIAYHPVGRCGSCVK